jgi:hypothetical protein
MKKASSNYLTEFTAIKALPPLWTPLVLAKMI